MANTTEPRERQADPAAVRHRLREVALELVAQAQRGREMLAVLSPILHPPMGAAAAAARAVLAAVALPQELAVTAE